MSVFIFSLILASKTSFLSLQISHTYFSSLHETESTCSFSKSNDATSSFIPAIGFLLSESLPNCTVATYRGDSDTAFLSAAQTGSSSEGSLRQRAPQFKRSPNGVPSSRIPAAPTACCTFPQYKCFFRRLLLRRLHLLSDSL